MLRINIVATNDQTPFLKRMVDALSSHGTGADKNMLNDFVATEAELVTRKHLRDLHADPARHKTAQRLGAKSSEHFVRAARAVASGATDKSAYVEVPIEFGLSRAFRDFDIKPVNAKLLTIPAHKAAYGRRAREFNDLKMVSFKSGARALVRSGRGGKGFEVLYWLVEAAHIPKDRTLLPPDETYHAAAETGARRMIRELQRKARNE